MEESGRRKSRVYARMPQSGERGWFLFGAKFPPSTQLLCLVCRIPAPAVLGGSGLREQGDRTSFCESFAATRERRGRNSTIPICARCSHTNQSSDGATSGKDERCASYFPAGFQTE